MDSLARSWRSSPWLQHLQGSLEHAPAASACSADCCALPAARRSRAVDIVDIFLQRIDGNRKRLEEASGSARASTGCNHRPSGTSGGPCGPAGAIGGVCACVPGVGTVGSFTALRMSNVFPEPWADVLKLTTTRPARQRWAAAESRSFERCVPTTSCRDRAPASSIPLRAHGPPAARICTSATAMRTRCGEGDLVGGWHAGASPFTPITRWVTKGGSSSASFAHTYTPLGRSQRL